MDLNIKVQKEEEQTPIVEKKTDRILIIDQFRGFLMLWICLSEFFPKKWSNSNIILKKLFTHARNPSSWDESNWESITFDDCITPAFLFVMGTLLRKILSESYKF